MKAAFFDIKPFEENFLKAALNEEFEQHYFSKSLNCHFEVPDEIKDADILSVFIESSLSKKVLDKFPNLKFIILRSVGYSHVDMLSAKERGIAVFNAPHYGDHSIAEYVFAILLGISRKIPAASYDIKNQTIDDFKYQGIELKGKTIGIVGLGAIGKKVYEISKGFSMNPVCFDIKEEKGYNFTTFDELCKKADIISINCPLNSKTLHMFNHNEFKIMKEGVIIVNTARGEVINILALYDALISGKVKFAALDVLECEDILYENKDDLIPIDSIKENCLKNYYVTRKLLSMENVLITPHIAYNTKEAKEKILEITVENFQSSLKFTNSAKNLVLI